MSKLNKVQTNKVMKFETMSARIRYLDSLKFSRGDNGRLLTKLCGKEVRYQWVKNVLDMKVKTFKESIK